MQLKHFIDYNGDPGIEIRSIFTNQQLHLKQNDIFELINTYIYTIWTWPMHVDWNAELNHAINFVQQTVQNEHCDPLVL